MSVESKLNERCSLYELTHGPTYLVFKHQSSPEKTSLEAKLLIIQNQESLSTALATFFSPCQNFCPANRRGKYVFSTSTPILSSRWSKLFTKFETLFLVAPVIGPKRCPVRSSNLRILRSLHVTRSRRDALRRRSEINGCLQIAGAGDGDRTRNFQLGKLTLYH